MDIPHLKKEYLEKYLPELKKTQGYKNVHQVPVVEKVVLNSGFDPNKHDKKWIEELRKDFSNIAGQKAVIINAKKSVSNFKLREGMPNGVKVTMRGNRMYDFLYRLIAIALPASRDFRGVGPKLDGHGNYNMGIADHSIFPEISADSGSRGSLGMDITIVTSTQNDDEAKALLSLMGMPFRKPSATTADETQNN